MARGQKSPHSQQNSVFTEPRGKACDVMIYMKQIAVRLAICVALGKILAGALPNWLMPSHH